MINQQHTSMYKWAATYVKATSYWPLSLKFIGAIKEKLFSIKFVISSTQTLAKGKCRIPDTQYLNM